jgi:multidrug resistance protein, MATE family
VGARDEPAVARGVQRGVLVAAILTVPSIALLLASSGFMILARQPPEIIPDAAAYATRLSPGVFPFFLFLVFRQSLQSMRRTSAIMIGIVVANLANAFLNWVLIFGHLGAPALGVTGSAWATTVSRWLLAGVLLLLGWRYLGKYLHPIHREVWQLAPLGRMLRLGIPIGCQYVLEFGAFATVALMMGWIGTREMAGHQVAINLASLSFMVPLGIADAASVLVGQAVGRRDPVGSRGAAKAALVCGASFMSMTGILFLSVPHSLAELYTGELEVIVVAAMLIPLAGVFQVFDGLQTVAGGVLRGLGDTRVPMLVNLVGYWTLGLPVSYYLGFVAGWGPAGLWWGLVLGLAVVASFLLIRVRLRLARQQQRVLIDFPPPLAYDPES